MLIEQLVRWEAGGQCVCGRTEFRFTVYLPPLAPGEHFESRLEERLRGVYKALQLDEFTACNGTWHTCKYDDCMARAIENNRRNQEIFAAQEKSP
jgi:hypothetical protein